MKAIVVGAGLAGLTCAKVLTENGAEVLATGATAVPALGMGEIPHQLASHLPEGVVNLNSPVERLLYEDDRVSGVEAAGEEHEADVVVAATDAPAAGGLTGETVPEDSVGQLCIYYAGGGIGGKKVSLNAEDGGFLNNVVRISNVSERYAPEGQDLVCAVALDEYTEDSSINGSMLSGEKAAGEVLGSWVR